MFNEKQSKRLSALAFYLDAEIAEVDAIISTAAVKAIPWKVVKYKEIRFLLADAANSIRDSRDIDVEVA